MAKASIGRGASAKAKAVAPAAPDARKAKAVAVAAKKNADMKTAADKTGKNKAGAPKMTSAPRQVAPPKTQPALKAGAPGKAAATAKRMTPGKATTAKTPAAAASRQAVGPTPPKLVARPKSQAKTVAVKTAAPRRLTTRTAVPTPAARRGRPTPAVRTAPTLSPARKPGSATPQVFTVSHLNEADFKSDGLRSYAQYRDLGIAAATAGLCQAHVIRMVPPCTDAVRKPHAHDTDLQLIYVLKGWMKNEFEGHGEQMMSTGSCWLQPAGLRHTVLDYSPDCEVLEIVVPANFTTEELG